MPSSRNSSSDKSKSKKAPDISKLAKLTPTKIPKTWRTAPSRASAGDLAVNVVRAEKVNWKKLVGFSAVIFLAVFLLYGWSLNGSYVFNDSINYSVLTTANSDSEFLTTALNRAFIYPLTEPWVRLTYALDSISFPKAIAYFHLVNISLHAVACIYLYLFVVQFVRWLRLDERTRIDPYLTGLLAALLLACHPLSTGAAAYISGRGPLLVAGNYFLCLNLFLLGFNSESLLVLICYYLLCLVFMAMGLFSGALGITIPMSITALIFLLKPTTVKLREWLSERWMDAMVFGSIALGFLFTLRFARPPILDNGVDLNLLSPLAYVATEAKVLVTYFLRCFIVPAGLSVAPPLANASGLSDPLALAGLVTMAAMIAGLWWLRNNTFLFFATLLTVLGLLPNFLVVQHEVVSDQRFYVGLSGLCLIFSWLAVTLISQAQDKTSAAGTATSESKLNVPLAASISVLIILSGLTLWRESSWLKPDSVWQQASMLNSTDARAVGMLADDYRLRGQNEKAVELANQALKLDPDCPPAWEALGENQVSLRQYGPAQSYLQRAYDEATKRKTAEDKLSLYTTNLAEACALNHDWSKAKLYAQQALVVRPMNAVLHVALGQSLLNENQPFLALQELNRVARIDPTNPDYLEPMADAALKVGGRQYVELALNIAYRAMRVKLSSHANLEFVRAALELGRVQAAMTRLEKILPKEPTNAEALLCMSYAMHLLGQENPAHDWEKRALAIDPHIKEKIKLKPVDKEAEHPTDIDRGGASTKALSAPAKPGATLAPAKPGATSAPAKSGATSAPAKPGATSAPAKPGATSAPAKPGATSPPAKP